MPNSCTVSGCGSKFKTRDPSDKVAGGYAWIFHLLRRNSPLRQAKRSQHKQHAQNAHRQHEHSHVRLHVRTSFPAARMRMCRSPCVDVPSLSHCDLMPTIRRPSIMHDANYVTVASAQQNMHRRQMKGPRILKIEDRMPPFCTSLP